MRKLNAAVLALVLAVLSLAGAQETTLISEVQGTTDASPLAGQVVVIEGIVVGDYQGQGELGGYYLQEQDDETDADPATSEGVFVSDTATDVNVGDRVEVTGEVSESFGLTTIAGVASTEVLESNVALPTSATVDLPVSDTSDLEAFEGMRVVFTDTLTVTETYNLGRFGEISLSASGRLWIPTNTEEPGEDASAQAQANDRASILLDDARSTQNPEPVPFELAGDDPVRGGDTVTDLEGILSYGFNRYRVQPVGPVSFTEANPRPETPPVVEGDILVASFNVLNYFTTIDTGEPVCGPSNDMECRGADSEEEFERQRAKILAALEAIDADIVGLIELENNASASLEDLVAGLNDSMGADTYDFIATGTIGTDAIKQGILYKPQVVTPVGEFAILDSSVDPDFLDDYNRPVLAQSFENTATGDVFTVAVNHLKSKGSPCDEIGDPDVGDGQGNCNQTRLAAAQALADWLATDPTGSGDPDHLIIGDLNAYLQEDPIDALEEAGFVNLIERDLGETSYTYVFDGEWGVLDHALATPDLAAQADVAVWHINADEPRIYDYNTEFNPPALYSATPYRSSDHDPVIVGLDFHAPATIIVSLPEGFDPDEPIELGADDREALALRAVLTVPEDSEAVTISGAAFDIETLDADEEFDAERIATATLVTDNNGNGQVDAGEATLGSTSTLTNNEFIITLDAPITVEPGSTLNLLLVIELADDTGSGLPAGVALAGLLVLPLGIIRRNRRLALLLSVTLLTTVLVACGRQNQPAPQTVTVQVTMTDLDASSTAGTAEVEGLPLRGQQLRFGR